MSGESSLGWHTGLRTQWLVSSRIGERIPASAQGHTVNLLCISLLPGMHSLLQYIVSIITLCCHDYGAIKSHFICITEVINLHLAQCSLIVVKGNSVRLCNSDESFS